MTNNAATPQAGTLENQLNSFDATECREALKKLAVMADSGQITLPSIKQEVNLHYHTFFSYNAEGWSPSRVAWEAKKYGLTAAGIVDFDVLDGLEEFIEAGKIIGLRTTVAMETRVLINEYSDKVLSSPNEPGIGYFMAAGCYKIPEPGTRSREILDSMRDMARRRNLQVMERVNEYLGAVQLEYDNDVLPLTPSGNATERHMLSAYDKKSRQVFDGDEAELTNYWAEKLGVDSDVARELLANTPKFHEQMRSKLMKFGGVGYVPPSADIFPTVDLVIEMTRGMGALPALAWLDGTNPGEADMPALLGLLESKGTVAMNIIPDRNWNIKDPEDRKVKVENLENAVKAARELDFPICVGTEMNKGGLPFVDNFAAPELQPYIDDFINGAYFFWGHTILARDAGIGYMSDWAQKHFKGNRKNLNEFYMEAGRLADPAKAEAKLAWRQAGCLSPQEVLEALKV